MTGYTGTTGAQGKMKKATKPGIPSAWWVRSGWHAEPTDEFEVGLDQKEKHSGTRCAYIKSIVPAPKDAIFSQLMQRFAADNYLGKRVKLSAWLKTKLKSGNARLWIGTKMTDGTWERGCMDGMHDRPIKKDTKWTKYDLVVEVPKSSTEIMFGVLLSGKGQIWLDDVSFETVVTDVPLTGDYVKTMEPTNLNFEEVLPTP